MENNVTSLSVSKKLKEAGFKKQSERVWFSYDGVNILECRDDYCLRKQDYYAYQVNELLVELPRIIPSKNKYGFGLEIIPLTNGKIFIAYRNPNERDLHYVCENTIQDALGEMKIWHIKWLKENDYIKGE